MAKKKEMDTRFSKFGTVSFTAITKVNDFIDYLEQGKVMATRCKDCGMVFFPPRADCYRCLASNMEWVEVSGTGKLVTYSKLEYAPIGFGDVFPTPSPCWTTAITRYSGGSRRICPRKRSGWAWI